MCSSLWCVRHRTIQALNYLQLARKLAEFNVERVGARAVEKRHQRFDSAATLALLLVTGNRRARVVDERNHVRVQQ